LIRRRSGNLANLALRRTLAAVSGIIVSVAAGSAELGRHAAGDAMGWELWVPRWRRAILACERLGGDAVRLRVGPPATSQELEEAECALGRSIPRSLRDVLLDFSGSVEFFWFLPDRIGPPATLSGVFCGECSWSVAGLVRINQELTWLAINCFTEDNPDHRLWANKFGFQTTASGDFLAIDLTDANAQPVVYLSHELDWSHGYRLASSFEEFIDRWTCLGCPGDDIFPLFAPKQLSGLDVFSELARQWCDWFGLPDPTAA